jgi:hypothetical protein
MSRVKQSFCPKPYKIINGECLPRWRLTAVAAFNIIIPIRMAMVSGRLYRFNIFSRAVHRPVRRRIHTHLQRAATTPLLQQSPRIKIVYYNIMFITCVARSQRILLCTHRTYIRVLYRYYEGIRDAAQLIPVDNFRYYFIV